MAPFEMISPISATKPAANLKRSRQSNVTPTAAPAHPRAKRRKPEGSAEPESNPGERDKSGRASNFGTGTGKGREDEFGDLGDVQTKIDFNTLPAETLYRYLEFYDLLPRWDVSPWSEESCTPPTALYSVPPPISAIPMEPTASNGTKITTPAVSPTKPVDSETAPLKSEADSRGPNGTPNDHADEPIDDEPPAPPTTRSKTAPTRRPPTPTHINPPSTTELKREVMTLSDVLAAREILAEKANAHWIRGLGGGQNKEGETIVNFLYKMKVGHGRLLRVYNPTPA
ncbi:MAG: hypothetical protein TREMPRED_002106 [Tremellales sp. Tagirdzhanova-0007]|nr:MAG: hypothetical protein TREMPRED_002106 [Tremellales sp. Tagirdzhanova-0007]